MQRRQFLQAGGAAGLLALAGCTGAGGNGESEGTTPTATPTSTGADGETPTGSAASLPDGVYVQRFRETMAMQGTARQGDYAVGLMYAAPHVFWNVVGTERQKTPIEDSDSVHLMAVIWDPETETVLPEAGVSVTIEQDGELVSQEVIYPMLSQRMGFHWGGNFGLPGDGEYVAKVSIGGLNIRRTGAFAERFDEPATVPIQFAFDEEQRSKVSVEKLEQYGKRGAVTPMDMSTMPQAYAPPKAELPGEFLAKTTSDDAAFLSTLLSGDAAARFDASHYFAVSARTPYNRIVLPSMAVEATVTRDDATVFEGALTRTLDPDLGYHYGAAIEGGLQAGDKVELRVPTPPQVARHTGYERAFLQMEPMRFTA
ncbi:MAG: fe2+ transport protein [Haloglomus sp.]